MVSLTIDRHRMTAMFRQSLLSLAAAMVVAGAASAASDPLAAHRWKDRVLLVLAPNARDARLAAQRATFAGMGDEAHERDLTLVAVVGNTGEARALRRQFDLGTGFYALLIGKDGGAKLTSEAPLGAEVLFPLIDAMPMRREEMQRRS